MFVQMKGHIFFQGEIIGTSQPMCFYDHGFGLLLGNISEVSDVTHEPLIKFTGPFLLWLQIQYEDFLTTYYFNCF